jgi:hypothetical protein
MSTTTKKGYSVGSQVAILESLVWLYGAAANVIAEVVDSRHLGGGAYGYKLASQGEVIAEDVRFEDLKEVR